MPGGDGTGPFGAGPMTGRGVGFCRGNDAPGCPNGRGGVRGMSGQPGIRPEGRRRGFRRWFQGSFLPGWMRPGSGADVSGTDDIDLLKRKSEYLERALAGVNARISELDKKE